MVDYQIAAGKSISEIEENVKRLMRAGWQPIGGICCSVTPIGVMFYQAMKK